MATNVSGKGKSNELFFEGKYEQAIASYSQDIVSASLWYKLCIRLQCVTPHTDFWY